MPSKGEIKGLLENKFLEYHKMGFIELDPISIPHRFHLKQDIEISAFFAATLAWGLRKTIINKVNEIMSLMDEAPYDFILNHQESDRKRFTNFKHRTFNDTDLLYFIDFLQRHYKKHESLQDAFLDDGNFISSKDSLIQFHDYFFNIDYAPHRTRKHVSTPAKKSACKRLNMLLRWMVRKDDIGVDFGLWEKIPIKALMMPLDVHVARVATELGLLKRKQRDWKAVEELTSNLKKYDPEDPIKYDFALFGMGVTGDW